MPKEHNPPITLRYHGLFDFDGMYAAVIDWAKNYGFKWHEKDYKHKVPSPSGAEQELTWMLEKNVTDYIKFDLLFTVHIWDLTEVQVETGGRPRNLSNARMYIVIKGWVTFNWQGIGDKGNKLTKWLGKQYYQLTFKNKSEYMDLLYYRTWNLHALMKKYFDMQSKKHVYKGYLGEN